MKDKKSQLRKSIHNLIREYYSYKHAKENGWKCTDHIKYCPPDQEEVWVCPECAKKEKWIEKR